MDEQCILQVEDDENDVFFLQRAFKAAGILDCLHVVKDGQQAIDYLSGTGAYADRCVHPLPSLVLLDLKLPRRSGIEVLEWIRQQPKLRSLVVVIFTSSAQPVDVVGAYARGANSFVVKPTSLEKRVQLANALKAYWLTYNVYPMPAST